MKTAILTTCCLGILIPGPVVMAGNVAENAIEKAVEAGFSELEKEIIGKYYKNERQSQDEEVEKSAKKSKKPKGKKSKKSLPPGLAKKDELPPGLQKQLEKNGTLPPGLAKRDLPSSLEKELPPPPEGYERQVVEDAAVVLVNKVTGKIADVITDAIIPD